MISKTLFDFLLGGGDGRVPKSETSFRLILGWQRHPRRTREIIPTSNPKKLQKRIRMNFEYKVNGGEELDKSWIIFPLFPSRPGGVLFFLCSRGGTSWLGIFFRISHVSLGERNGTGHCPTCTNCIALVGRVDQLSHPYGGHNRPSACALHPIGAGSCKEASELTLTSPSHYDCTVLYNDINVYA